MKNWRDISLSKRSLIYITILLIITNLAVGISAFMIAKRELDLKGKIILENSVSLAAELAAAKYDLYQSGELEKNDAIEQISTFLNGEKQLDGSRNLDSTIDLGKNGYFIIYSLEGDEILHPKLEGQNLYDAVDPLVPDKYIVRDQIDLALNGGGYYEYNWQYADTESIGEKITFCKYQPDWHWIIVASNYKSDFNKGANIIISIIFSVFIISILIGFIGAMVFISSITKPLSQVIAGMKLAGNGEFIRVKSLHRKDEVGQLIDGFNNMSSAIDHANYNLRSQADHISYLAYNDTISELPNRNRFKDYVDMRVQRDIKTGILLQMDIKDFKIVNSAIGNRQSDQLLKLIGSAYLEIKVGQSMIARTSGNEFSIWMEDIDQGELQNIIRNFNYSLKSHLEKEQISYNVAFHYAYSSFPENGDNFEVLFKYASIAMKYAKEARDLKLYQFENCMLEAIENNLKMSKLLENAIFNQEISAVYQNKVSLKTGKVIGVEALARWHSSSLGDVSPEIFIPAINQSNLTHVFGQYMFEKVCFEFQYLKKKLGDDIKVSINISPIFFLDRKFIDILNRALDKFKVSPEAIMLEITEDIFINDIERIQNIVLELRSQGFSISLDDFGTGYSSLNYLRKIQVNEVKIDKSFIDRMYTDEKTLAMLQAIRELTLAYGYDLVAEGVEAEYQIELLKKIGYDIVQGYYYSKPEPVQYD